MGAVHANGFTEKLYAVASSKHLIRDAAVPYSDDKTEHGYTFGYVKDGQLANSISFRARPMPGCCGVLVVYYLRPNSTLEAKEAARLYKETVGLILEAAKAAKYGMVAMSLLSNSHQAIKILREQNFTDCSFINGKTGNGVVMLLKNLEQPVPASQEFVCD